MFKQWKMMAGVCALPAVLLAVYAYGAANRLPPTAESLCKSFQAAAKDWAKQHGKEMESTGMFVKFQCMREVPPDEEPAAAPAFDKQA